MARVDDIVSLLAKVPVFEAMGPEDLRRVAEVAVPRRFEAGQVIFREGDASDTCYVVRSGHARAVRENVDGRAIALAHFGPGDIFGELAMFDAERRSATLEGLDDLDAIAIAGSDMRRLMRQHAEMSAKLAIALARRLREANERLSRQSFQTVQSRVAGELFRPPPPAEGRGGGPPRRRAQVDAGGDRPARRLVARVGQPLPRRAGAGGDRHAGPR